MLAVSGSESSKTGRESGGSVNGIYVQLEDIMKSHVIVHDRDQDYARDLRVAVTMSLVSFIGLFLFVKQVDVKPYVLKHHIDVVSVPLPDNLIELPRPVEPRVKVAIPIPAGPGEVTANTVGKSTGEDVFSDPAKDFELPIMKLPELDVRPAPLNVVVPDYPEMARMAGIDGKVVVEMLLDTLGNVTRAQVLASSGNRSLDAAALAAAEQSTFSPGIYKGRKARVWISMPFKFSLQ
jgi:protein TonB